MLDLAITEALTRQKNILGVPGTVMAFVLESWLAMCHSYSSTPDLSLLLAPPMLCSLSPVPTLITSFLAIPFWNFSLANHCAVGANLEQFKRNISNISLIHRRILAKVMCISPFFRSYKFNTE